MTGEISPCQTPAVVNPNDPDHRGRDERPPRRRPAPPATRRAIDVLAVDAPDAVNPPHIGTRINVRV